MNDYDYYFVTDIETNGPLISKHSMLSFASVVVRSDGKIQDEFEAVLSPRAGYGEDTATMEWWKMQPEAYHAATSNAQDAQKVMMQYSDWVKTHPDGRIFAARPLIFDGGWINEYLQAYTGQSIMESPWQKGSLFTGAGLDIPTYMMGVFSRTKHSTSPYTIPQEWLGNHPHTHRAIDDARGYAQLLSKLFKLAKSQVPSPLDFLEKQK